MTNDHISPEQKAADLADKAMALEAELAAATDATQQKALTAKIQLQRGLEQFHRERAARAVAGIPNDRNAVRYPRMQNVALAD